MNAAASYQADEAALGDCLVGTRGALLPCEQLKRLVLKGESERWTLTLDMCRSASRSQARVERILIEIP